MKRIKVQRDGEERKKKKQQEIEKKNPAVAALQTDSGYWLQEYNEQHRHDKKKPER